MGTDNKEMYSVRVLTAEPQEIEIGTLNKTTGLPKGPTTKASSVVGMINIPNYSKIWGKRVKDKATNLPNGDFEELPWSTEGGEVIEIQHHPSSSKLDKAYHTRIGLKLGDEDIEIELKVGINNFNTKHDPVLVRMLQLHSCNASSVCRDPQNTYIVYETYDSSKTALKSNREEEIAFHALSVVMDAKDNSNTLKVYAHVFGIETFQQDAVLQKELIKRAKDGPQSFLERLTTFQNNAIRLAHKANQMGAIDFSQQGEILTADGKTLLDKIPTSVSPEKKADYIGEHVFEPAVFDILDKIIKETEKAEMALN